MTRRTRGLLLALLASCGGEATVPPAVEAPAPTIEPGMLYAPARPFGDPIAVVDLMSADGAASVSAEWRFVDASIVEVDSNDPGPDLRPTGPAARSHDVSPRPRASGWDEAAWAPIDPPALAARRGHGHFALGWFRTRIALPARIGATPVGGATIVLEIVADDYSEVWVDGHLSAAPGDAGGGPVSGFNAPNRVVLTRSAEVGHVYDVAVLAMNAPLSVSPPNFLWMRSAVLDVYVPGPRSDAAARIERRDPELDAVVGDRVRVERIATGFSGLADMVWTDGALLFCDARANTIFRYDPTQERIGAWRSHSGYSGADLGRIDAPGARGLAVDTSERVLVAEGGNQRIVRIERTAATTVLAERFEDRPLEGLRDVAIDAHGIVWAAGARGVLRIGEDGAITRASETAASAVVPSHDGASLFVAEGPRVVRRTLAADGTIDAVAVVHDTNGAMVEALAADTHGHLYVASGSTITIVGREHVLGVISLSEPIAGLTLGGDPGPALFVAGRTTLYRVELAIPD